MAARFYPGAGPFRGKHVEYHGFDFNREGIARCAVGPEIRATVQKVTTQALAYAQLVSPGDDGSYEQGFRSDVRIIPDYPFRSKPAPPMARWAGFVQNVSRSAILVEVGSDRTPAHRVLGRTLEWLAENGD